jgi:ABC-2 type transport system permease protein
MLAPLTWTEVKLLAREPLTLLVSLGFPLLLMVLLAGSFGNDPDPDMGGVGGTDFYVPVYATATIASMGFLGLPLHLATYREAGVLRRYRAAGAHPAVVLLAQVVVMAVTVLVGTAVMVAVGFAAFGLSSPASAVGVVAGLVVGTVAFAAIGVLLGTLLPTARAAQGVGLLLFFGLFFVAGGGPPPALLPDALNRAVDLTPMGPLVDAVSDPWHGRGWDAPALAGLGAVAVAAALATAWRLRREP